MAIDTAEKRFSMLNFGDGTHIHMMIAADGRIDADDRMHFLDLYSGFELGELRHSVFRRSGVSIPIRARDADRRVGSGGVSDISTIG